MKKRAAKAKRAAKPSAAKKSSAKTKAKTKPAAKTAATAPKPSPYTPAPIKGDGWPPFRYPLE
jgi:hypothetical protein